MSRPRLTRRLLIIPALATGAIAPAAAMARSGDPTVTAAKKPPTTKIVLGKSIGGISLGMSHARVKHLLGKPDIGKPALIYLDAGLVVGFGHNKVDFVGAAKPRYRTSKGIHTGSSRAAVTRAYPQAQCKKVKVGKLKEVSCRVRSGSTSTEFTMNQSGRTVDTIDVSRP